MIEAVTLRQLRYLVALAETLHFGKAAQACCVSQPSLSAQIQQLEDLLGTVLVERTQRQVLLTAVGKEAVARARRILAEVDDLGAAVGAAKDPLAGPVRLGVIPTIAPFYLPQALPHLAAHHPGLKLSVREDMTERLLESLRAGRLDVLLLALPLDETGVEETLLFDEPFRAAVPIDHPLAAKAAVGAEDFVGSSLLLLDEGHCFRDQALAVCGTARRGDGETAGFAAASLFTLMALVAGGLGVTLLPAMATGQVPSGVAIRPFKVAGNEPGRRIGLAWRIASPRRAGWEAMAATLRTLAAPEGDGI